MDIAEIRRKAKQLREKAEEHEERPLPPVSGMEEEKGKLPEGGPAPAYRMLEEVPASLHLSPSEAAGRVEAVVEEDAKGEEKGPKRVLGTEVEVITFLLDNEEYAIDIHQIKEVIKTREMTEVPRTPTDIVGVISLRGVVVPVMSLRGRLGMPMKGGGERIVIVKDGSDLLGLLVDSVRQVVRIPESGIEATPSVNTIEGEFIRGIGRCKGGMFILLDMEKILERM